MTQYNIILLDISVKLGINYADGAYHFFSNFDLYKKKITLISILFLKRKQSQFIEYKISIKRYKKDLIIFISQDLIIQNT